MSFPHAWIDDVRPSPYADQLALGFRLLRFVRPLELEYRGHKLDDNFKLRRIALSVALLLWLAFAGFDLIRVAAPQLAWILVVRLAVFVLLLVCAGLILQRRHVQLLQPLSLVCILALGIGSALVVGIAHHGDLTYPYEGLLLVSMAAYFLVGLRLSEARRLMLNERRDAADAAFQVGYESPSQFSREYSRLFGAPPLRDLARLRSSA